MILKLSIERPEKIKVMNESGGKYNLEVNSPKVMHFKKGDFLLCSITDTTPYGMNMAMDIMKEFIPEGKRKYIDRVLVTGDIVQIKNKYVDTAERAYSQGVRNTVYLKYEKRKMLPITVKDLRSIDFKVMQGEDSTGIVRILDTISGETLRIDSEFLILSKTHNRGVKNDSEGTV